MIVSRSIKVPPPEKHTNCKGIRGFSFLLSRLYKADKIRYNSDIPHHNYTLREFMGFYRKKSAFTLAEVLITLGIIGVVAALTMPAVIANYQKQETVSKLKKFYSVMQQALTRAELEYGNIEDWDFGKNDETILFFNKYLRPYLQVAKTYNVGEAPDNIEYKCINGRNCNSYGDLAHNPRFVLSDGTMILATDLAYDKTGVHPMMNIIIDTNGFKAPNRYGRDVFAFSIQKDKKFVPAGVGYTSALDGAQAELDRDWIISGNERGCSTGKDGFWCAALIMIDGWEIKDDYPWK